MQLVTVLPWLQMISYDAVYLTRVSHEGGRSKRFKEKFLI